MAASSSGMTAAPEPAAIATAFETFSEVVASVATLGVSDYAVAGIEVTQNNGLDHLGESRPLRFFFVRSCLRWDTQPTMQSARQWTNP